MDTEDGDAHQHGSGDRSGFGAELDALRPLVDTLARPPAGRRGGSK
jgi:hypothetical protein